jgi:hypothetical protein
MVGPSPEDHDVDDDAPGVERAMSRDGDNQCEIISNLLEPAPGGR